MRLSRSPASMRLLKRFNSSWNGFSTGIPHMGSLQAQRAIQTRWWHHSQVLQGQSNSGLSSERLITNRLGFNKNSLNSA